MGKIDKLDKQILDILMKDANVPYTEIAKRLFVSGGTIHVRMNKLREMGVVKGAHLEADYSKLGYDISAFLGIYLDNSSMYEQVAEQLKKIPEVTAVHYTTGVYNIFAKIVCRDTAHLREVLHDKLQKVEGINRTETMMSLEESLNRPIQLSEQG